MSLSENISTKKNGVFFQINALNISLVQDYFDCPWKEFRGFFSAGGTDGTGVAGGTDGTCGTGSTGGTLVRGTELHYLCEY